MFRQCVLQKKAIVQVAWIPEQFAKEGLFLEIKEDDGWEVIFVGTIRLDDAYVSERSQDYKHQRKASDI